MSKESTARNKAAIAITHAKRMLAQGAKRPVINELGDKGEIKVPRGTARNLRRKHLQTAYAKRLAAQA